MSVVFTNYSMESEVKYEEKYYDWCVFVAGDAASLQQIVEVKYELHPTFPNPIRVITDRAHRVPLISSGWGEFHLRIGVILVGGENRTFSYRLRLAQDNSPKKDRPLRFDSKEQERVYDVLTEGQFRFCKLNTIERKTGLSPETAEVALRHLEALDLARKAHVRSIDQQEMWGSTSIVGVIPRL
jgi:transcription initiation factor IIF auxiliary subunit